MESRNNGPRLPPPWITPAAGRPGREVRPVITVNRRRPPAGGGGTLGSFTALGQTTRNWVGGTKLGSDVYYSVIGGSIYKQTNGTGNFASLGSTVAPNRNYYGMASNGVDVYVTVFVSGDIYKQTAGAGNFIALGQTSRDYRGIACLGNDVYVVANGGDIYK